MKKITLSVIRIWPRKKLYTNFEQTFGTFVYLRTVWNVLFNLPCSNLNNSCKLHDSQRDLWYLLWKVERTEKGLGNTVLKIEKAAVSKLFCVHFHCIKHHVYRFSILNCNCKVLLTLNKKWYWPVMFMFFWSQNLLKVMY